MGSDDDAQKAIEMWNGQDFGGRKLTVNEANLWKLALRAAKVVGSRFGGGNGGGRVDMVENRYVGMKIARRV